MCVSYCHRRNLLYWNHESCAEFCPYVAEAHGPCTVCCHRRDGQCGLTRAPLPADGCCHYEVDLVRGPQVISLEMIDPLIIGRPTSLAGLLDDFEVPYQVGQDGQTLSVDPDELALPPVYGLPTEAFYEEEFAWPEVMW